MANIDPYIEQIENARYGKDVRDAIVNALNAMNTEITTSNVTSFNSRTGDVLPVNGDYNISQISAEGGHDGQIPVVNSNGGFTMRTMHGEIDMLNQLDDVEISNPSTGDILRYRNSVSQWENIKPLTVSAGSKESSSEGGVHLAFGVTDDNIFNIRGIPIRQSGTQFNLYPSVLASMPTAEGTFLGNNILYVGETTSSYTQGCIYKCIKENDTYKWQLVCDLSGGAESLSVISTQTGTGSKTATVDISKKQFVHCIVKKGTEIVISKAIPTCALSVSTSINLGTSASITGNPTGTASLTAQELNTYAGANARTLTSKERHTLLWRAGPNLGNSKVLNMYLNWLEDVNEGSYTSGLYAGTYQYDSIPSNATWREDVFNLSPKNLYTTLPAQSLALSLSSSGQKVNSETATGASITYSATNTFTLSVTDSNLTLMLIA